MTLVLGALLANGEVIDPNETMDKENATENKRYSAIIPQEKKRRISQSNSTTSIRDNGESSNAEKEGRNGQEHNTRYKNTTRQYKTHDPQEKSPTQAKPLRTSKSGSHKKGASQIKKHGDDSDSEEESFARDLKDRKVLEALERASNIEIRERADQARINRSFFDRSRHPEWKEQQAAYQALCEADLFNPPSPPPGFNLAECTEMEPLCPAVQVPGFSLVAPYVPYNPTYSRQFYEQYKTGYIHMYDDDSAISPRENSKGKAGTPEKEAKVPFYKRVAEVFNLLEWTTEEINFFEELLHAQGPHFEEISRLMCGSKNPAQLRAFFNDKWASSVEPTGQENKRRTTCHLCFQHGTEAKAHKKGKARLDRLVVCGGCERAYHVVCLNPRPTVTDPWYCSEECVSMSMLQCQLCGNAENDEQMLLCDTCDRGYHMFCLKPPLTSVPDGDWNCPLCTNPAVPPNDSSSAPTTPTASRLSNLQTGVCTHSTFDFINTIRSGENPRVYKVPNTHFLELNPANIFSFKPSPASTPKQAIKGEITDKSTPSKEKEATQSASNSPVESPTTTSATEQVKTEPESSSASVASPPPPPPLPPPKTRMSTRNKTLQSPTVSSKSHTKSVPPLKIPPQSPTTPRQSPRGESPSSITSPQEETPNDTNNNDEDESIHLQGDPEKIVSSALPHSLLAIKHWGKEMCVECLLQAGLLPGDAIFGRRGLGKQPEIRPETEEYHSIFAQPLVSRKYNYKTSSLIKRFDAILAAVNIATQQVLDGKIDSNNHAHVLPVSSEPIVPTPADPSTSRKRSAETIEEGPNKQVRTEDLTSSIAQLQAQDLTSGQWWVFTYNPRVREVANLRPQAQLEWQVRQHAEKIKSGDRVYVWVSGKSAGIYALGTVTRDPFSGTMHPGEPSSSGLDRTCVRIDDLLPHYVPKEVLEEDTFMRTLNVLRLPAGHVNYSVTPRHTEKLAKLICSRHLSTASLSSSSQFGGSPSDSLSPFPSPSPSPSPSLSAPSQSPLFSLTPLSPKDDNSKSSEDPNSTPVETKPSLPSSSSPSPSPHSPAFSLAQSPYVSNSSVVFKPINDPTSFSLSNNNKLVNAHTPPPVTTLSQFNGIHKATSPSPILSPSSSPSPSPSPSSSSRASTFRNPLISPTTHPPFATPSTPPIYQPPLVLFSPVSPASFHPIFHQTTTTTTTTHTITTNAPQTQQTQMQMHTHTCDACKRTEPGVCLQCLGCKDWYHPTCTTTHTGTLSLLPWYCPPCATLNQQGRACAACASTGPTNKNAPAQPLLVCDMCARGYHPACVTTPLPAPIPRCWLCVACMPTQMEITNAKLSIGWRELRLECIRIMSGECEYACETHRKGIYTNSKSPSRIFAKMHELTYNLAQLRQAVVAVAQNRYACWAKSLVLTLPSVPSLPSSSSSSSPPPPPPSSSSAPTTPIAS